MTSIVYTSTRSKMSKKQRAKKAELLKEQRAIKKSLEMSYAKTPLSFINPSAPVRNTQRIASVGDGVGNATLAPAKVYTGDAMIGIGQMHKSNAVPIFKQEEAEDIAKMRR